MGHAGAVRCLAFSPDGRVLVSGGDDGRLILWDPAAGSAERRIAEFGLHRRAVISAAFSPDGKSVASVSVGRRTAAGTSTASLSDLIRRREIPLVAGKGGEARAACFTDGGAAAVLGAGEVRLYDPLTGAAAGVISDVPRCYAFAAGAGGLIAAGGVSDASGRTPRNAPAGPRPSLPSLSGVADGVAADHTRP